MGEDRSAFARLPGDDTLARAVSAGWVALQSELLRAGAQWEEALAILGEMVAHGRPFPSATDALAWYRSPYHPSL